MTNSDFIKQYVQITSRHGVGHAKHGNLFYDQGILYSYGYHWPLCYIDRTNGIAYVNIDKYSRTTTRHTSDTYGVLYPILGAENIKNVCMRELREILAAPIPVAA